MLEDKKRLFIDFDGVIVNTIKRICDLYNYDFVCYPSPKVNWKDIKTLNFDECTGMTKELMNIYFDSPRFFEELEFMPFAELVIKMMKNCYEIVIVSKGFSANLLLKSEWVHENIGAKFIGIGEDISKSEVDMAGGIFIDDKKDNLEESNADVKILFGRSYPWNEGWTGEHIKDWQDFLFKYKHISLEEKNRRDAIGSN